MGSRKRIRADPWGRLGSVVDTISGRRTRRLLRPTSSPRPSPLAPRISVLSADISPGAGCFSPDVWAPPPPEPRNIRNEAGPSCKRVEFCQLLGIGCACPEPDPLRWNFFLSLESESDGGNEPKPEPQWKLFYILNDFFHRQTFSFYLPNQSPVQGAGPERLHQMSYRHLRERAPPANFHSIPPIRSLSNLSSMSTGLD